MELAKLMTLQQADSLLGKPNKDHIKACNTRLKNELAMMKPKIIVLLGKVAYTSFFGVEPPNVLGTLGWIDKGRRIYFVTHPSFVVRELSFAEQSKTADIKLNYLKHFQTINFRLSELKK